MGITDFFSMLFESNEMLSPRLRLDDEQIAKRVADEFKHRKGASDFLNNKKKKTVNAYRGRYNMGNFHRGIPPKKLSLRYKNGQPVNYRTGTIILLPEEVEELRENHRIYREKRLAEMI